MQACSMVCALSRSCLLDAYVDVLCAVVTDGLWLAGDTEPHGSAARFVFRPDFQPEHSTECGDMYSLIDQFVRGDPARKHGLVHSHHV